MTSFHWHPGTLLELSGSYWKTCALHAAVELDLFTRLGGEERTAEELAGPIAAEPDALARLLDALTALGLIQKTAGRYGNTAAARQFLSAASPEYLGHMIQHHHHLMTAWQQLPHSVRTGKPTRDSAVFAEEKIRTAFLKGMWTSARLVAAEIVKQLDLHDRRHLLDMGGGPGTYAIAFCRANPELTATVMDLPTSREIAETAITEAGLTDRIVFTGCNYVKEEVPGRHDVVWMSHILHGEGPATCRDLLGKVCQAAEPGALVIIHDFLLHNDRTGPLFPALFSLNMLVGTENGRAYTESEVMEMMAGAGFSDLTRLDYSSPMESGLITAHKTS